MKRFMTQAERDAFDEKWNHIFTIYENYQQ